MTEHSIWPATNGPNTDAGDAADISRGVLFRLSAIGWVKRLRFYRGTLNVGNWSGGAPVGAIMNVPAGTIVAGTQVTFSPSGTGWQEAALPVPVQLAANTSYKVVVLTGNYTATGGYFSTGAGVGGIVSGIITAPDAGGNPSGIGNIQQGSFKQPTTGLEYPNQYFNGGNYWVDVVVDDTEPSMGDVRDVTGTITITPPTVDGDAAKTGLTSPTLAISPPTVDSDSDKVGITAPTLNVDVNLSAVSAKVSTQSRTLTTPTPVLSGAAQAIGPGVHMPVSAVLCSPWASYVDVPQRLRDKLGPDYTEAEWTRLLLTASEILWALSGRRWYGEGCTETAILRSLPPMQGRGSWPYHRSWGRCGCWVHAVWMDGQPYNVRTDFAHTGMPYAIQLPRSYVNAVTAVEINGDPFAAWSFTRNGWLERTDGSAWDVCSGLTEVTYQWGEPPPHGGKMAALSLAYQFGLAEIGDDGCAIPNNTTTITRQGITISRVDPNEFLNAHRTGVPDVDLWLVAVNPQGRPSRGGVWSPDIPSTMRSPQ